MLNIEIMSIPRYNYYIFMFCERVDKNGRKEQNFIF